MQMLNKFLPRGSGTQPKFKISKNLLYIEPKTKFSKRNIKHRLKKIKEKTQLWNIKYIQKMKC